MNQSKLLTNAETWVLSKGEAKELNKIEVQTLKSLFALPTTTPTAAVLYSFGLLYTTVQIDSKQFIYLHKILNRPDDLWTKQVFNILYNYSGV